VSVEGDGSAAQVVGEAPDMDDPRHRDRQVADIVARLCATGRSGETPVGALRAALMGSGAPVRDKIVAAVAQSFDGGQDWARTSAELHRLARRWRSPIPPGGSGRDCDRALEADGASAQADGASSAWHVMVR
jgi:hypothetical protein